MIRRLLVANRAEIACRVIRTCRALGIETVALYADVDRDLPHVQLADRAVALGGTTATETYLDSDKVLATARETGADAIHPGYGFLSENAGFARACEQAGIVFVGPPARCIDLMGDKAAARREMANSGVPVLPGFDGENADDRQLREAAEEVGFPLLIKAVAGGGGKGMRVVDAARNFDEALQAARREASGAFGDARMLLERFLPRARHVEVQVFADEQGNVVHLFERDCSIQRRHQKIIEEAPAPGVDADLREALGQAAVRAARAIDYRGAGTVEFLLAPDGGFHFMEMNTRLQVEHPVTEAVTGEDLVAWQLSVAAGCPLPRSQQELRLRGHAMEARVYAEDPERDFMPSTGTLEVLEWPEGAGVRVDAGFVSHNLITSYYDPMLAKVIARGDTREQARRRLRTALHGCAIAGVRHNAGFLAELLGHPAFAAAELSTSFLPDHPDAGQQHLPEADFVFAAAGLLWRTSATAHHWLDPWQRNDGWRGVLPARFTARLALEGDSRTLAIYQDDDEHFRIALEQRLLQVQWQPRGATEGILALEDTPARRVRVAFGQERMDLFVEGHSFSFSLQPPARAAQQQQHRSPFAAPMSGSLVAIHVSEGDHVDAGAAVVTMEAMKMEQTLRSPSAGRVVSLPWSVGDTVTEGTVLAEFHADGEAT